MVRKVRRFRWLYVAATLRCSCPVVSVRFQPRPAAKNGEAGEAVLLKEALRSTKGEMFPGVGANPCGKHDAASLRWRWALTLLCASPRIQLTQTPVRHSPILSYQHTAARFQLTGFPVSTHSKWCKSLI